MYGVVALAVLAGADVAPFPQGVDRVWVGPEMWANRLAEPPAIHRFLDATNATSVDASLEYLAVATEAVRAGGLRGRPARAVYST